MIFSSIYSFLSENLRSLFCLFGLVCFVSFALVLVWFVLFCFVLFRFVSFYVRLCVSVLM